MSLAEKYRIKRGDFRSIPGSRNGAFEFLKGGNKYLVICSDGLGWDHVSMTIRNRKRTPSWAEMQWVKQLFFEDAEPALQIHAPEDEHVNNHKYCLHLWRDQKNKMELPESLMVGIKGLTDLKAGI